MTDRTNERVEWVPGERRRSDYCFAMWPWDNPVSAVPFAGERGTQDAELRTIRRIYGPPHFVAVKHGAWEPDTYDTGRNPDCGCSHFRGDYFTECQDDWITVRRRARIVPRDERVEWVPSGRTPETGSGWDATAKLGPPGGPLGLAHCQDHWLRRTRRWAFILPNADALPSSEWEPDPTSGLGSPVPAVPFGAAYIVPRDETAEAR